tara:strand:- start:356 stop:1423 length:1068 start_codon:yes stop_codon:yes gene_type:complete
MKILKDRILDKLKKKNSFGADIWDLIGNSKFKNDILNDKDVMFLAAKKGIKLSDIKNSKFVENEKFLLKCVGHFGDFDNLEYLFKIKSKFTKNKKFIKKITNTIDKFLTLKKYKSKFFKDKDIVYSLLKYRADAIIFADQQYINDKKLVMKAMNLLKKQRSRINSEFYGPLELMLEVASKKIHPLKKYYNDEKFVDIAVQLDGNIYSGLSNKQKLIKRYALAAVKHGYFNLQYVPHDHKNYREILIEAMKDKSFGPCQAIEYMDPKYKSDQEVIFAGIKAMSESPGQMLSGDEGYNFFWKYIDNKLKADKSFVIKALNYGCIYLFSDKDLKDPTIKKVYEFAWEKHGRDIGLINN